MFDSASRYYKLPNLLFITSGNKHITYKSRRFLPQPTKLTLLQQYVIIEGDRLDLIAAKHLGDPLASWQIADANNAMYPKTLTEKPGDKLQIAAPSWDD